jgi:hypothetical protein
MLSAPAPPVPTASTEQKYNQDNNQNRFYAHFDILLYVLRGLTYEVGGSLDGRLTTAAMYALFLA